MSLDAGREALRQEAAAVLHCADQLDDRFATAVRWVLECEGRTITCGIGKSGHIARKIAGTLSSTGTPSLFLHAAEAMHGDLGMVTERDIVLAYSHSGETDEIVDVLVPLRSIGAKLILVTARPESSAGRLADLVLPTYVTEEACPNNLAPTTSTTVMLALSDALAIAVMKSRDFGKEDFARFHPSGALGKRLLLRVEDVMRTRTDLALVSRDEPLLEVMRAITSAGVGAACVLENDRLVGFISDGDLRRHFIQSPTPLEATARQLMKEPRFLLSPDLMAIEALESFQNLPAKVGEMPVVDESGRLLGLLMLKDLLRSGIV